MNEQLMEKMAREKKFFLLRKETLMDQLEKQRIKVLNMEFQLEILKKDLKRTDDILEVLSYNGI